MSETDPNLDTKLDAIWKPSLNFQPRWDDAKPTMIVIHYTGTDKMQWAMDRYLDEDSGVSRHYMIDEDGSITQLVKEENRAWHASRCYWAGNVDIDSASIGIELANPGHDNGYKDFPDIQMDALAALCKDISTRHDIQPHMIVGNSDIAPRRKKDPGEKFDWKRLHEAGVGHWVEPEPIGDDAGLKKNEKSDEVLRVQTLLRDYGYLQGLSGKCSKEMFYVIQGFQRHFRPERIDGNADKSTIVTLERLVESMSTQHDNTNTVSGNRPANY